MQVSRSIYRLTMPKLLQINTVINSGSTGRIAEDIGRIAIANGWESYIAFGRNPRPSASHAIRIGSRLDVLLHVLATRLFDLHGLASRRATKRLVRQIERIRPDVIHLHNIHGYYLNYKILFRYLAASGTPVVWTMHDCWAATGHCPHYTFVQCIVWQSERGCRRCPQKKSYPKSVLFSNAAHNFRCKRKYFNLLPESQLTIVTPSRWLSDEIGKSYLGHYRRTVINNGIDLEIFKPSEPPSPARIGRLKNKKIILGVANVWDERKGLADFIRLSRLLRDDEAIVLVGLNGKQTGMLPENITTIARTESQAELAQWYSAAAVFFNPSVEETQGLTTIEAMASGTSVIVYNCTACPEAVDEKTGFVVEPGDMAAVLACVRKIEDAGKSAYQEHCVARARELYDRCRNFLEYIEIYAKCVVKKGTNMSTNNRTHIGGGTKVE